MSIILPIILCFIPLIAAFLIFAFALKINAGHLSIAILLGLAAVIPISVIQFGISNADKPLQPLNIPELMMVMEL